MSSCSKCLAGATPVGDLTVLTERKHLSADSRSCCPFSLWANKAGVSLWTGFNPQYWRDFSHPQWLQWWCRGLGADILSFLKLASRNISFNPLKDGLESWSPFVDFYNDMDVVDPFRKEWRTTSVSRGSPGSQSARCENRWYDKIRPSLYKRYDIAPADNNSKIVCLPARFLYCAQLRSPSPYDRSVFLNV